MDIMYSLMAKRAVLYSFICSLVIMPTSALVAITIFLFLYSITFIVFYRRLWLSVGLASESQPNHERTSQPESLKPIRLKLLIDKSTNRVVFAECDKNFVDVLLSFLTLPMGKIISLADKESGIGSMDELYKSVESLGKKYFRTKACKSMLLEPRSACGLQYNNLAVKIDETDYTKFYTCSKTPCLNNESFGFVSLVENSICACGRAMDNRLRMKYRDRKADSARGFVTGVDRFIVSDDLQILPATISNTRSLLLRQGIRDNTCVQEWNVHIGLEEVLKMLHHSILSKTTLTDVFLPNGVDIIRSTDLLRTPHRYQTDNQPGSEEMNVKLWFSKSTNKVICIEANGGFTDFLLSFLTLPLGSIIKLLKGKSSLGSIDNLYKSVEKLSASDIVSAHCKEMLLSPKLERMFGCENQLLEVEEEATPSKFAYNKCYSCCLQKKPCSHIQFQMLKIMNPKCPGTTTRGGGFVREQGRLLVTDGLVIEPLSPVSGMNRLDIPFSDMEELSVTVGKAEALALLKAALTSKTVLNHAFGSQVINRNRPYYS